MANDSALRMLMGKEFQKSDLFIVFIRARNAEIIPKTSRNMVLNYLYRTVINQRATPGLKKM